MATGGADGTGGRIHLEAGHRVVAEAVRARIFSDPERREAVDVKADDFDGVSFYVSVAPEEKTIMRVSLFVPCFAEIKDAVGDQYFQDLFAGYGTFETPQPGYSLTVVVDLESLPADDAEREGLVTKLSTLKRDVVGAPLWVSFKALLGGVMPPRTYYIVPYRPTETMYIVPSDDLVVVVYSIVFDNHVEQAIARVFLQEISIARKQSRDLMTAPSVTYSMEPPHELKTLPGLTLRPNGSSFIGYVSLGTWTDPNQLCVPSCACCNRIPASHTRARFLPLLSPTVDSLAHAAISKRIVESGRLENVVTLTEGYRSFLMYHVQATKSQLHTRIRRRSNSWLQVLNRAMPEKLNVEKKTIKGRTFIKAGK